MFRMGQQIRSAVVLAVYRKALRLSVGARQATSVGQIVNIMSTDAQRMQELTTYLQMVWSAPLQIALSVFFLWKQVGVATLAGIATMVLFVPVNGCVARLLKRLQTSLMKQKDKRVNTTNEVRVCVCVCVHGCRRDVVRRARAAAVPCSACSGVRAQPSA